MSYGQREFFRGAGTLSTGTLLSIPLIDDTGETIRANPVLRLAHLSDIHLRPDLDAPGRLRALFRHIRLTNPDIDLWLNSGDSIYAPDGAATPPETRRALWQLWRETVAAELPGINLQSCLGPHDYVADSPDPAQPASKAYAQSQLGIATAYRSLSRNGWHICILDGQHHTGTLGAAQLTWLDSELEYNRDKPVLILSHHPLASFCGTLTGAAPHPDWREIIHLFNAHPNVTLCLSGHTHLLDRVWYNGVKYCCNGAASGHWWEPGDDGRSACRQTPPGYALIDLYADGTSRCEYLPFPSGPRTDNAF